MSQTYRQRGRRHRRLQRHRRGHRQNPGSQRCCRGRQLRVQQGRRRSGGRSDHSARRRGRRRSRRCAKAADAKAIIETAVTKYGRIDILVNNSGVYEFGPLEAVTETQFHKMFDINVLGLLLVTQAASAHLGEGGSIINIGSGVTAITPPQTAVYTASKGAVDAITGVSPGSSARARLGCNSVSPSLTQTEGTHSAGMIASEFEAGIIAQTPLGRLGQPQDIADVVAFVLECFASRAILAPMLLVPDPGMPVC